MVKAKEIPKRSIIKEDGTLLVNVVLKEGFWNYKKGDQFELVEEYYKLRDPRGSSCLYKKDIFN